MAQRQHKTPKAVLQNGTMLQQKAARAILEATRTAREVSTGQILREVGYSKGISIQPSVVTQSAGFLAELAKLGLTQELVVPALVADIQSKVGKRAFELSIAGKWLGLEHKDVQTSSVTIGQAIIHLHPPVDNRNNTTLDDKSTPVV